MTEMVMTEREILEQLKNWGRWKYRDEFGSGGGHCNPIYIWMRLYGKNPMLEGGSVPSINEEEAMLMNNLIAIMEFQQKQGELYGDVLYQLFVLNNLPRKAAHELDITRQWVYKIRHRAIGWLCENARMYYEIWDAEKELIDGSF